LTIARFKAEVHHSKGIRQFNGGLTCDMRAS
jgi:hypothetical protein